MSRKANPTLIGSFVLTVVFSLTLRLAIGKKCKEFWEAHRQKLNVPRGVSPEAVAEASEKSSSDK